MSYTVRLSPVYKLVTVLFLTCCVGGCPGSGSSVTDPRIVDPQSIKSCAELVPILDQELMLIQQCTTAAECGQVLSYTSCGCTRNLVARLDADLSLFDALMARNLQLARGGQEDCRSFVTTCDCPLADGFACVAGRCTWNYVMWL